MFIFINIECERRMFFFKFTSNFGYSKIDLSLFLIHKYEQINKNKLADILELYFKYMYLYYVYRIREKYCLFYKRVNLRVARAVEIGKTSVFLMKNRN